MLFDQWELPLTKMQGWICQLGGSKQRWGCAAVCVCRQEKGMRFTAVRGWRNIASTIRSVLTCGFESHSVLQVGYQRHRGFAVCSCHSYLSIIVVIVMLSVLMVILCMCWLIYLFLVFPVWWCILVLQLENICHSCFSLFFTLLLFVLLWCSYLV